MKRLSPWGLVSEQEVYIKGRQHKSIDIGGVTQLDYLGLVQEIHLYKPRIISFGSYCPG